MALRERVYAAFPAHSSGSMPEQKTNDESMPLFSVKLYQDIIYSTRKNFLEKRRKCGWSAVRDCVLSNWSASLTAQEVNIYSSPVALSSDNK